ncbi:hypothetical protein [Sphaerisporangium aureirubrum]|uniref:Secreted protein n=1 Tax=Sphaerisporangium aureirubrum TaxID=1544736 RepID=A0ABW1NX24_9ACTN
MTITWVAVVVAAVVAIVAVGYFAGQQQRRRRLQERFGPEYERTVRERESRREAEQDLREREQRHAQLNITELAPETRSTYAKKWTEVQERFVDAPGFAVTEADHLVTSVMADRGYPTEGFEQQVSDLSVAHGATLDHYRTAHEISRRAARQEASTEELRQAMVHYRALFEELLGVETGHVNGTGQPAGVRKDDVAVDSEAAARREDLDREAALRHEHAETGSATRDEGAALDEGAVRRDDVRPDVAAERAREQRAATSEVRAGDDRASGLDSERG